MKDGKFTVPQLKEVLKRLGLSPKGNKPDLLKRLFEHDPAGTWKQWVEKIPVDGMLTEEEATMQSCAEDGDGAEAEEEMQQRRISQYPLRQEELRDRELEILRRERDIMQRELEILRREREVEMDARLMATPMTIASQRLDDAITAESLEQTVK